MLLRQDGSEFTTGRSTYAEQPPDFQERTAKIFVKIGLAPLAGPILAQLDTGAGWSMLDAEVAEAMSLFDAEGEPAAVMTRKGRFQGKLARVSLEMVADEGDALNLEATVWVCREWSEGTFLGYSGLLDHLRFAIDPSDNSFYFGFR
jgi:hypothetical protein